MKGFLAIAALMPVSAWAAETPTEPYSCWGPQMMWGAGWYGMIFRPLFMILAFGIVVVIGALIVRSIVGPWQPAQHGTPVGRRPVDILKERFARGEIDKNEFDERRRVLGD